MQKKILVLTGSPNKNGNTSILVKRFVEGCRHREAEVKVVDANGLKYKTKGCISCRACQKLKTYRCVITDDATKILAQIPKFDILVFATPVYTFGPSAQLKLLIDRTYALVKCEGTTPVGPLTKMRFALIASASGGPEALVPIQRTFAAAARFLGIPFNSLLVPFAGESGGVRGNTAALTKAYAFGRRLGL